MRLDGFKLSSFVVIILLSFSPILATSAELDWKYQTGDKIWSSPAVYGDSVLFGSNDGNFYSISSSGEFQWIFPTSGDIVSSPVVYDDKVFFGSLDGYFYSLNMNGSLNWKIDLIDEIWTLPTVSNGIIYLCSQSETYAFYPNGTIKWVFYSNDYLNSKPVIAQDGSVYLTSTDGNLYAIEEGDLKWYFETDGEIWSSPEVGSDGTIYFASYDKYLYAVNPDGTLKWRTSTFDISTESSPAIGINGDIYISLWDLGLNAFGSDGEFKWSFATGGEFYAKPTISSEGLIYIGSNDNNVYALDQNGAMKWGFISGGPVSSSIALDGNKIYFGSDDGFLYALNEIGDSQQDPEEPPVITGGGYVSSSSGDIANLSDINETEYDYYEKSECDSYVQCDDGNPCTTDICVRSDDRSTCYHNYITMCASDDGCCPPNCAPEIDDDCECENECFEDTTKCEDDRLYVCRSDLDGSLVWKAQQNCLKGCCGNECCSGPSGALTGAAVSAIAGPGVAFPILMLAFGIIIAFFFFLKRR